MHSNERWWMKMKVFLGCCVPRFWISTKWRTDGLECCERMEKEKKKFVVQLRKFVSQKWNRRWGKFESFSSGKLNKINFFMIFSIRLSFPVFLCKIISLFIICSPSWCKLIGFSYSHNNACCMETRYSGEFHYILSRISNSLIVAIHMMHSRTSSNEDDHRLKQDKMWFSREFVSFS